LGGEVKEQQQQQNKCGCAQAVNADLILVSHNTVTEPNIVTIGACIA
jgi:hypothetical protein